MRAGGHEVSGGREEVEEACDASKDGRDGHVHAIELMSDEVTGHTTCAQRRVTKNGTELGSVYVPRRSWGSL